MQTTSFRHANYTDMLSYHTGQEWPDTQEFLFALSTLLNMKQVKKLTPSHFYKYWLLQRYEHKLTFQSTLTAVSCDQAQHLTHS